jgi:hypothetical protein
MPLLDHFTEPVSLPRQWESFHTYWAAAIGGALNRTLPERFFAAITIHPGGRVEADIAEFDRGPDPSANGSGGGIALETYAPPAATAVLTAAFPDDVHIPVIDRHEDGRLAAVIELISPSNKHDPIARRSFAGKCAAYLAKGVGVVVVDPVLTMRFNLHDELIDLLRHPPEARMPTGSWAYGVAYRPARRDDQNLIDVWAERLTVGTPLPTLPLALLGWATVPLDLEDTYMDVCRLCRLV